MVALPFKPRDRLWEVDGVGVPVWHSGRAQVNEHTSRVGTHSGGAKHNVKQAIAVPAPEHHQPHREGES